jgi:hypothetical protein
MLWVRCDMSMSSFVTVYSICMYVGPKGRVQKSGFIDKARGQVGFPGSSSTHGGDICSAVYMKQSSCTMGLSGWILMSL